jgi:hypothetical protein
MKEAIKEFIGCTIFMIGLSGLFFFGSISDTTDEVIIEMRGE